MQVGFSDRPTMIERAHATFPYSWHGRVTVRDFASTSKSKLQIKAIAGSNARSALQETLLLAKVANYYAVGLNAGCPDSVRRLNIAA